MLKVLMDKVVSVQQQIDKIRKKMRILSKNKKSEIKRTVIETKRGLKGTGYRKISMLSIIKKKKNHRCSSINFQQGRVQYSQSYYG